MQKIADVVGSKVFISYISKLTAEQKKIYDDLSESRARVDDRLGFILFLREKKPCCSRASLDGNHGGIVGRKLTKG